MGSNFRWILKIFMIALLVSGSRTIPRLVLFNRVLRLKPSQTLQLTASIYTNLTSIPASPCLSHHHGPSNLTASASAAQTIPTRINSANNNYSSDALKTATSLSHSAPTSSITSINNTLINSIEINEASKRELFPNDSTISVHNKTACSRDNIGDELVCKYPGKVLKCFVPGYPNSSVFLCGTLHVSSKSTDMVRDVIRSLQPECVVIELCKERTHSLYEPEIKTIALRDVIREAYRKKSLISFGTGLITWLQLKAAKTMNNRLGNELSTAASEGALVGSSIILGDRPYSVTVQRLFDNMSKWEAFYVLCSVLYEVATMTMQSLKDYISKSDDQETIDSVIGEYRNTSLGKVIISERDEYLAQSIIETVKSFPLPRRRRGVVDNVESNDNDSRVTIVAVVGAGHLKGIQNFLRMGGSTQTRLVSISSSSKHRPTWPGERAVIVLNNWACSQLMSVYANQR